MVVREFERIPSVVYCFLLGTGPSVQGIPTVDGGLSAFMLKWSCLRVLNVVVDVDEGVGWQLVVWCVCWIGVSVVESEVVLEPFVVLWGPGVRCPGWIWCVKVRCGCGRVCLDFRSGWVKSWWEWWWNT